MNGIGDIVGGLETWLLWKLPASASSMLGLEAWVSTVGFMQSWELKPVFCACQVGPLPTEPHPQTVCFMLLLGGLLNPSIDYSEIRK